jgi:VanZ family protein
MLVIFSASGDTHSFQHSSRIIGPVLHWLFPAMSEATIHAIVVFVRKCAHLTEYAILALLFWRMLRKPVKNDPRPWSWRHAAIAVGLVAVYAATDEFHQLFVPSRDASVRDVLIDTLGGAGGMALLWTIGRWRKTRPRTECRRQNEE